MTEHKTTGTVIKKDGYVHTVECGGKQLELQLSERVQKFYRRGLEIGKVYNLNYDDEQNLIMFARESEPKEKSNEETSKVERSMTPSEYRGLQAQIGGLTHDAVHLIKEEDITDKEQLKEDLKSTIKVLKEVQDELVEEYKNGKL